MNQVFTNIKLNPQGNELIDAEVRVERGTIVAIGSSVSKESAQIIDGMGRVLFPGFVDVHVHFREPGFEDKETIKTGAKSAACGGFTSVCCMPNTNPVIDNIHTLDWVQRIIERDSCVHVYPYATITHGLKSHELSDYARLKERGAFAFTNDGVGVQDAGVMFQAMLKAKALNVPIVAHTEEDALLYGGVMHEGVQNKILGLPGMLGLTESTQIARDILLAKYTGVHYHVCHVSDKDSVAMIREGKRMGVHVTAEVTPHHLLLTDADIQTDDANFKMNPPLRSEKDREALIEGLMDGTLDFIASDHAPHTKKEKAAGFRGSPFGIIGLETTFPLLYTHFVKSGRWTLAQLIEWISTKPASVFNLNAGRIEVGSPADLVVVDLDEMTTIQAPYESKASNTPFEGWEVSGCIKMTWVDGELVYEA